MFRWPLFALETLLPLLTRAETTARYLIEDALYPIGIGGSCSVKNSNRETGALFCLFMKGATYVRGTYRKKLSIQPYKDGYDVASATLKGFITLFPFLVA